MTPHISAEMGEIAKIVLLPGDPLRAKFIAENYLENPKLVSDVRNVCFYTGTYSGREITVGASGMGNGSMGIYSYELFTVYGVEKIIRIGTAGSYLAELRNYDLVLVEESYSDCLSFSRHNLGEEISIAKPCPELNSALEKSAKKLGIELKKGRVHSYDVYYDIFSTEQLIEESKAICVEMESFGLFVTAQRLKKQAACLLTVSDNIITQEETTPRERERSMVKMIEVALGSL